MLCPGRSAFAIIIDVFPERDRLLALGVLAEPEAAVGRQALGLERARPQPLGPQVAVGAVRRILAGPRDEDGEVVGALAFSDVALPRTTK